MATPTALTTVIDKATGDVYSEAMWDTYTKDNINGLIQMIAQQNLLTNGGFEINTRGGTVTANNAYAHDRWQIKIAGTSTFSITNETSTVDTGSGAALKNVYVHNTASQIDQKIEEYLQLRGRTVTFRIRIRQGAASTCYPYIQDSGAKTYGATSATTGSYVTLSVALAIGASATSVTVGVEFRASDTCYLDNATLIIGDTAPNDYQPLNAAEEIMRCKRYYEVVGGVSASYPRLGRLDAVNTNSYDIFTPWGAKKAVAPTTTKNGTWTASNCGQPSTSGSVDGFAITATANATAVLQTFPDSSDDTISGEANP